MLFLVLLLTNLDMAFLRELNIGKILFAISVFMVAMRILKSKAPITIAKTIAKIYLL